MLRNTCIFSEFPTFLKTPNLESNNAKQKKECHDYRLFLRGMNTITITLSKTLRKKQL